jgi:hypothetical protein
MTRDLTLQGDAMPLEKANDVDRVAVNQQCRTTPAEGVPPLTFDSSNTSAAPLTARPRQRHP